MGNPSIFSGLKPTRFPKSGSLPDFGFDVGFVIKDWFFNTDNVKKHLTDVERIVLNRFGATTRTIARRSMKNRPATRFSKKKCALVDMTNKPTYRSKPGEPPHAHAINTKKTKSGSVTGGLKYGPANIVYGYNPYRKSVVIGPRKKSGRTDFAPMKLEYGGTVTNVKNSRRIQRKVGDTGAIKAVRRRPKGGMKSYIKRIKAVDRNYYYVYFARLKSDKMVRHCSSVERKIWGPLLYKSFKLAPRPYMRPAFKKSMVQYPRFWQEAKAKQRVYFTGL